MSGSSDEMASESITDKELLSLFKKVSNLSADKKKTVKDVLEAFVFKVDVQQRLV